MSLFLHIDTYEISSKSSHSLSLWLFFFSFLWLFNFFPFSADYTLVGAAVSQNGWDTKRRNEGEDRDDEEKTKREKGRERERERERKGVRTSVDPPSGIARLICPITLNNPRDNSIAGISWDRSRGRPALSELSAICECKFPFPSPSLRPASLPAFPIGYTRITRVSRREISEIRRPNEPANLSRSYKRRSLAPLLTNEPARRAFLQAKKKKREK